MSQVEKELQRAFRSEFNGEGKTLRPIQQKVPIMAGMKIQGLEIPLYSAAAVLTRDTRFKIPESQESRNNVIGRIDVIFTYKGKTYVSEIKDYDSEAGGFWYASKCLCYCEYFKWQRDDKKFFPAVIICQDSLRLEHQVVSSRLGITIFTFKNTPKGYVMQRVGDEPYWKQKKL